VALAGHEEVGVDAVVVAGLDAVDRLGDGEPRAGDAQRRAVVSAADE
jgi:hypothetical protein